MTYAEQINRLAYEAFKKEGETRAEYEARKFDLPF